MRYGEILVWLPPPWGAGRRPLSGEIWTSPSHHHVLALPFIYYSDSACPVRTEAANLKEGPPWARLILPTTELHSHRPVCRTLVELAWDVVFGDGM